MGQYYGSNSKIVHVFNMFHMVFPLPADKHIAIKAYK